MKTTSAIGWLAAAAMLGWTASGWWQARLDAAEKDELQAVSVQIAQVYQELAEFDLNNALDANRRVPESFSASEVRRLERAVATAKARVASAQNNDSDPLKAYLASAQERVRMAESELVRAQEAVKTFPNSVAPIDMKRLEGEARLARLRLKQLELVKGVDPLDQLRWQVDLMAAELSDLKTRVLDFSIR